MSVTFQSKSEVRSHVRQHKPSALPLMPVLKNLSQFLDHQSGHWSAFKAFGEEPAIEGCLRSNIQWYYPRLSGEHLEFVHSEKWQRSALGFPEPVGGVIRETNDLDGFLIPGIAFSKKGQRVGRGKGYYDRALEGVRGLKVGICYSYQLFPELPVEAHDVQMDVIVSDQGITWLKR